MIGIVYKIEIGEKIYIGSTITKLNERQRTHNSTLRLNKHKYKLYEECRKHNITEIICILLETKEIENELEIRLLEQDYIDKLKPSLNSNSGWSGLTKYQYFKERQLKNKEKIKEYNKGYYENNREKYLEQKKEYREKNREKINKKQREKINCPICNSLIRRNCMREHQRTKKCLKSKEFMNQI